MKTKIDFQLGQNGKWKQFCLNEYNKQEHIMEYNDEMTDLEFISLLKKLVAKKIIKPQRCKGIIRIDQKGTLYLRYRYYSSNGNMLEKEIFKRILTLREWQPGTEDI